MKLETAGWSLMRSFVLAGSIAAALWSAPSVMAQTSVVPDSIEPLGGKLGEAEEAYRKHITTLSNPFFEGRAPGTNGNVVASDYLEFYFKHFGLEPLFVSPGEHGETRTYKQAFSAGTDSNLEGATAEFTGAAGATALTMGTDYSVLGFSGSAEIEGEVAFVGYAVEPGTADAGEYSSFGEKDDLSGKIAMVLRFEPMDEKGKSRFAPEGQAWGGASDLSAKIRAVVNRNAAGIILVNTPGTDDPRATVLESTRASARWTRRLDIPVVMVTAEAADRIVKGLDATGRGIMDLRKEADVKGEVVAFGGGKMKVAANLSRKDRTTWNVAGVLRGRGKLADEYVVVGAHFDHVGYGYSGGSMSGEVGLIHPGADDNASGSSGMLVAAEMLAAEYAKADPNTPARSIIFMGFSAEETGLVGSRYFVQNCPLSASQIYCMLNMDMIGRLRLPPDAPATVEQQAEGRDPFMNANGDIAGLQVTGVGTADGFEAALDPLFAASGMKISKARTGRGPSDHASFYSAGIPVLFFFTGLHQQYHTPADRVELINVPGAVRVVSLVCDIARSMAGREGPLAFTSTDKPAAADPHGAAADGDMPARRVRFGIMPGNYNDDAAGVLVGDVTEGAPAAVAGIKKGDRLVKWGGAAIENVEAWTVMLSKQKPGDEVDVTVVREGAEQTFKVKLTAAGNVVR